MKFRIYILLEIIFFILNMSCTTTNKTVKANKIDIQKNNAHVQKPNMPITILDTPDKENIAERLLDADLINNVEKGSVDSLIKALAHINNDTKGLTETNRLYLIVIYELMHRLYPNEPINWAVPTLSHDNKYISAFKNITEKKYPETLSMNNFLDIIIPTFIVLENTDFTMNIDNINERLTKAQIMNPTSVIPALIKGVLYEKTGFEEKAKQQYQKAWSKDHSCTTAGIKYAFFSAKSGDGITALNIAHEMEGKKTNEIEHNLLFAESYIALKQYDQAEPFIISILSKTPDHIRSLLLRITGLIAKSEYLKANALLDAFATKSKTDKDYLLLKAKLTKEWSKNTNSALTILNEAYKLYPSNTDVLLACSEICFETGKTIQGENASQFLNRVLSKNPNNIKANTLVIKNDIGNGNWEKAIQKSEKMVAKYPSDENLRLLATAYLGTNRNTEALRIMDKLYFKNKNPSDKTISLYMEALQQNNKIKEMNKIINTNLEQSEPPLKSILYYYKSTLSSGKTKLSLLRSSLLSDPRNTKALFAMYTWHYKEKDYQKAEYYLKQVIAIDPLNKQNDELLKKLQYKVK